MTQKAVAITSTAHSPTRGGEPMYQLAIFKEVRPFPAAGPSSVRPGITRTIGHDAGVLKGIIAFAFPRRSACGSSWHVPR